MIAVLFLAALCFTPVIASVTSSGLLSLNLVNSTYGTLNAITDINPVAGQFIPYGWGATYYTKLQLNASSLIKIGIIGDSVSSGVTASINKPNSAGTAYSNIIAQNLQALYGDGGAGFIHPCQSTSGDPTSTTGYIPVNSASVVFTGSWACKRGAGTSFNNELIQSFGSGATVQFYGRGTSISIYAYQIFNNNGIQAVQSMNIVVNRLSDSLQLYTESYSVPRGSSDSTNTILQRVITGLPLGVEYTITVTVTSANNFYLAGVASYNSVGVVVHNFAVPSTRLRDLILTDANNGGYHMQLTGGELFSSVNCDLIILSLDLNDVYYNSATYQADLLIYLNQITKTNQPLMFLQQLVGSSTGTYNNPLMQSIRMLHTQLSFLYNYAFIDLNTLIGRNNYNYQLSTLNFYVADGNLHPNDIGQGLIATSLIKYLKGVR